MRRNKVAESQAAEISQAPLRLRGRAKKERRILKGRVSSKKIAEDSSPKQQPPTSDKSKSSRENWEHNPHLAAAVEEWDNNRTIVERTGKLVSFRAFAQMRKILCSTFHDYAKEDKSKRKKLGIHTGRPAVLKMLHSDLLCQVAIRADRANEGLTPALLSRPILDLKSPKSTN